MVVMVVESDENFRKRIYSLLANERTNERAQQLDFPTYLPTYLIPELVGLQHDLSAHAEVHVLHDARLLREERVVL
jgi:hypothetical protein